MHLQLLLNALPFIIITTSSIAAVSGDRHVNTCRSYCGNLTVDYPFATKAGCGHPGYRDLLFCMNDVLMLHISSGSYRVLEIDYAYQALTLHDPHMSTCNSMVGGAKGNGFVLEPWRAPFLEPTSDNVFLLLGCSAQSPLFQGFPGKHLPCRNVSGMGCEDYYDCPAWRTRPKRASPPVCCSVSFEAIRAINLTKLECEAYSSAYSLAPVRVAGAGGWSYGIRVTYSIPGHSAFCQACEATGGTCGYDTAATASGDLCMCDGWNSTSNCDSVLPSKNGDEALSSVNAFAGLLICTVISLLKLFC